MLRELAHSNEYLSKAYCTPGTLQSSLLGVYVAVSFGPPGLPWIPHLLSPNKVANLLYFETLHWLTPYLLYLGVGVETKLDSVSSSHSHSDTPKV